MPAFKKRRVTKIVGDESVSNFGNESTKEAGQAVKSQTEHSRSLFVRSLPASMTTPSLTALFSESYPLKHATVVLDPLTKLSKGYGFVTFADVEDVQSAKEAFNGSIIDGQRIKVELARPRKRQGNGPENGEFPEASRVRLPVEGKGTSPRLIVRNLPWTIKDADQLSLLFRSFGKVKQASVPKRGPGLSAGFGFVLLRGYKNAEKAMEVLNGKEIDGRAIAIDWAVDKDTWISLRPEAHEEAQDIRLQKNPSNKGIQESALSEDDSGNTPNTFTSNDVEQNGLAHDPEDENLGWEEVDIGTNKTHGQEQQTEMDFERKKAAEPEAEGSEGSEEVVRDVPDEFDEDKSSTLFIRNLPFTATDELLYEHFKRFGSVKYAKIVVDQTTERSKGVGFVCFYSKQDVDVCIRSAPKTVSTADHQLKSPSTVTGKQSLLQDTSIDRTGSYTLLGRVLQISRAVDRKEAARLTFTNKALQGERDKDKRRLYLLEEGFIPASTSLYRQLSQTEIKMRDDSIRQRQSLMRTNPSLHLSLTRLSVRNLPRNISSKALKALAREAAVGFAKDVKGGLRPQLTKGELSRGGKEMKDAEQARKTRGKGIVKQAKVVFESREGSKVAEDSGAGRSRGYGFIEYFSHRWALMGLRWLNGRAMESTASLSKNPNRERKKRLIVEFAIENAQVVLRRRERELKARETSKLTQIEIENEEHPSKNEGWSKDQATTSNGRGLKRKQDDPYGKPEAERELVADGLAKRQKIIGRKRMLRRSKASLKARMRNEMDP